MGSRFADNLLAGLVAVSVSTFAGSAFADGMDKGSLKDAPEEAPKRELQFTGNFAATSDYIFRGFSQSGRDPAVQAGVDATYKWFYVGAWGSLIDFGRVNDRDIAHTEIDYYAGIKPVLGPVTLDIGIIYYTYPNARDTGAELDYVELKVGGSTNLWKDATAGVTFFYSPEYTGKTGSVWTVEGAFSQALPAIGKVTPTFSSLVGYQAGDTLAYQTVFGNGDDNYFYWNSGVTFAFGDNFSLDFRYWDTNVKDNAANKGFADNFCHGTVFQCNERFVATAKVTF